MSKHVHEKTAQRAAEAGQTDQNLPAEPTAAAEATVAAETAATPEAADPCIETAARIASLEAELSNYKDQFLRKAAEFENFRKRMNREKQEAIDFANQSLLLDMIPVIDDFERAIKSSESSRDFDGLYEGISLIEKRLVSQLENKWGLVRFESAGSVFDPNRHEGIMVEKSAEVTEPTVGEDFVKGYTLKDRVVRSAKVKVLMPQEPTE